MAAKSAATLSLRRHAVLSLTTKFRLPHEGMADLEYLSRGSAFLLDTKAGPKTTRSIGDIAVLTCQHVACPWLFPKYFADKWDWLQHVSEEFVVHSLQLLELPPATPPPVLVSHHSPNDNEPSHHRQQQQVFVPRVLAEFPLERHVWLHPSRDVAMLALSDSIADVEWDAYAAGDWNLELLTLQARKTSVAAGDVLLFTGHKQFSSTELAVVGGGDAKAVGQYPKEVLGNFVGESSQGQAFAWSEEVLEEGMCGGAVVNTEGECVGLVEGIVPPFVDHSPAEPKQSADSESESESVVAMRKALANHVAFVPVKEIASFVEEKGSFVATGMLLGLEDDDDDDALW
ncbi:hypothetical protein PybrP1_011236 [[Pythium] brassicae (nom. inval.)]|nr:hypothetical protein PybrP1_011236 [[Pythium] brassicae (nom. inval.)]